MLLDASRVPDWQKQMVLTSTGNSTEFTKIETALMAQLGQQHLREKSGKTDSGPAGFVNRPLRLLSYGGGKGRGYGGKGTFRREAYIAGLDDINSEEGEHVEDIDPDALEYDDEVDDEVLAIELNL